MTREEAKSCIGTIEMLQRLAYNIHGVMDVIDADNCKKIIIALEQEPILDLIREEIENTYYEMPSNYNHMQRTNFFLQVIKIIDRYKAESEVSDGWLY